MNRDANIIWIFLHAAQQWTNERALIHDQSSITYAELLAAVQQSASGLRAREIGKGDTVLVLLPMSIELYACVLALFYIGAVPVFLDSWSGRKRLSSCLATVPCKGMIASRKILWLSLLFRPLRQIPIKCTPSSISGMAKDAAEAVCKDDTALITFTTGSTGVPKAANRTHGFLQAQLNALMPILPAERAISFTTLPIVVLLHLAMGKTTVLPPSRYRMNRSRSIRYLASAISLHEITDMVVSPSVMALLVQYPAPASLRNIITGGGPVFPELARKIVATYPKAKVTIVFGSTEAEPISHISAAEVAAAGTALMNEQGLPVGIPDPSASVRIIPPRKDAIAPMDSQAWERLCLPAGSAGEIVVSGAHVLAHYINNPQAEAFHKINVDGIIWHRTGDAGRIDEVGKLYFLGRCQEMIEWNGQIIFPVIVADRLAEIAGIRAAALLKDAEHIIVVLEADAEKSSTPIIQALNENGIRDARLMFVHSLPRDPRHLTKVDYDALRILLRRRL